MKGLCIFDLDGTILNTLGGIHFHLNRALTHGGYDEITRERCRTLVGHGLKRLVVDSLHGIPKPEVVHHILEYLIHSYRANPGIHTHIYPGILELLHDLFQEGYVLTLATNKNQYIARDLVTSFFPELFTTVLGAREGFPMKPDPRIVHTIQELYPNLPAVFIGDSEVDLNTAQAADIPGVLVNWGFGSPVELQPQPEHLVSSTKELHILIKKLLSVPNKNPHPKGIYRAG